RNTGGKRTVASARSSTTAARCGSRTRGATSRSRASASVSSGNVVARRPRMHPVRRESSRNAAPALSAVGYTVSVCAARASPASATDTRPHHRYPHPETRETRILLLRAVRPPVNRIVAGPPRVAFVQGPSLPGKKGMFSFLGRHAICYIAPHGTLGSRRGHAGGVERTPQRDGADR